MGIELIWNHAYAGRAEPKSTYSPQIVNNFTQRIQNGDLPFLSFEYWPELEKELFGFKEYLSGFKHMLLLGIGGSALGARALQKAFLPSQDLPGHNGPSLWIADNVCTDVLEGYMKGLDPGQTVVVVVSKSGGTIETIGQYLLVKEWLKRNLSETWNRHLVMVTDPDKGYLREESRLLATRSLPVPKKIGGRYSVLSAVGLLPATFMGLDCREIMSGARKAAEGLTADPRGLLSAARPAGIPRLALWARDLIHAGYSQLIFFVYIPQWACFGQWFAQLWAESLGKKGKGSTPIPAVGVTDQHSLQQMFLDGPRDKGCFFLTAENKPGGRVFSDEIPDKWAFLKGQPFCSLLQAEALGTRMALTEKQVPLLNARLDSCSLQAAGALIVTLEAMTYLTGLLLDINPLDQPAVELGKRLANAQLGADDLQEEKKRLERFKTQNWEKEEL